MGWEVENGTETQQEGSRGRSFLAGHGRYRGRSTLLQGGRSRVARMGCKQGCHCCVACGLPCSLPFPSLPHATTAAACRCSGHVFSRRGRTFLASFNVRAPSHETSVRKGSG